jgi:hypothetical protein
VDREAPAARWEGRLRRRGRGRSQCGRGAPGGAARRAARRRVCQRNPSRAEGARQWREAHGWGQGAPGSCRGGHEPRGGPLPGAAGRTAAGQRAHSLFRLRYLSQRPKSPLSRRPCGRHRPHLEAGAGGACPLGRGSGAGGLSPASPGGAAAALPYYAALRARGRVASLPGVAGHLWSDGGCVKWGIRTGASMAGGA